METLPSYEVVESKLVEFWNWLLANVLTVETTAQLGGVVVILFVSKYIAKSLEAGIEKTFGQYHAYEVGARFVQPIYWPITGLLLLNLLRILGTAGGFPVFVFELFASVVTAWIIIRFAVNFIANRSVRRVAAFLVWGVAVLNIVGWLDPVIVALKAAGFSLGDSRITAYGVIWGTASFVLLIWVALVTSRLLEARLRNFSSIDPSARVLIGKAAKIGLVTLAFLVALNSTGIDLTALAVFGGALGVGLGFGLQKVVSNFISGVILLLDRSIKPGDVIEIQGTYGSINSLAARYTSVITRDGTEYLIPNEDMITQSVVNWSHSNTNVRRKVPVNVAYKTDLRKAMDIMNEAAAEHERVLSVPAPRTLLTGFGDNGVDLELRMWISDPQNGVSNVASEVLLNIWDAFHEADIEFPFPQRVVHMADDGDMDDAPAG